MENLELKTESRDVLGKKTRFLRRQGVTPGHLFGHGLKSQSLQIPTATLEKLISRAGTTRLIKLQVDDTKTPHIVLIREVQKNPVSGQLIHVDFYQVNMKEKMTAEIPIVLVGDAPALKAKGHIMSHPLSHLSVECLPDRLPHRIEVDVTSLEELDAAIHVSDITLDPEVAILTDPDELVAKISEVAAAKIEEEEVAAEAEEGEEGEEAAEGEEGAEGKKAEGASEEQAES